MKVSFEATLEDHVDVMVRSNPLKWDFYLSIAFSSLASGTMIAILTYYFFGNPATTAISAIAGVAYVVFANYNIRERRAANYLNNTYHPKWPVPVEIEVNETGISFKEFGITTAFDWKIIASVEEEGDAIYFKTIYGQISAVRTRAFTSDSEKKDFIQNVHNYIGKSREPLA